MKKQAILHFCIDILIVTGSFLFIIWLFPATRRFYLPAYQYPFLAFLLMWMLSSLLFGKYRTMAERGVIKMLDIILRANSTILAVIVSMIYFFNRFSYSRKIVFGTFILASILEIIYAYVIHFNRKQSKETDLLTSIPVLSSVIDYTHKEPLELPERKPVSESQQVHQLLEKRYLKSIPGLYPWIEKSLPLHSICKDDTVVLYSHHIYNIAFYESETLEFFINLYEVNDLRHVNNYFRRVWHNLKPGGYYLVCAKTNDVVKQQMKNKLPPGISGIAYLFHFLFHRVMPKIPGFSQLYFGITKGKNRAFSFTEILGRLYYAGFSSVAHAVIGDKQYYLVMKTGKPVEGQTPTYGPIIKLNRVGKEGKPIKVLKMRTMHPYSEFLQDFVYQQNHLQEGGKFKNDFRITTTGKILRKLWLDEIPMVINLIRGDLKIVGVRPISQHYLNLYSQELQQLRKTEKPGLIPPFYADLPKTLEEIETSELRYLKACKQKRIITDLRYFFKAMGNILLNRARSG
ncbi:MAG: hypothetical protein EOL88_04275 [Bacteroidia bacterium]|nr:sugar transferase [Bacteroidales bacterium]NCD41289.1 hypothetical protein [Bacteroidia bacterium]